MTLWASVKNAFKQASRHATAGVTYGGVRTGKTLAVICIGSASIVLATGCSFNRTRTPVRATVTMSTATEDAVAEIPGEAGSPRHGIAAPGASPGKRATRTAHDGHHPGASGKQEPRPASSIPGQRGVNPSGACSSGATAGPGCPSATRPGGNQSATVKPAPIRTTHPNPPAAPAPPAKPSAPATTRPPAPTVPAPVVPHAVLQTPARPAV